MSNCLGIKDTINSRSVGQIIALFLKKILIELLPRKNTLVLIFCFIC